MSIIYFLLRSSWQMVAIAVLTGFLSGGSSAGLIALISQAVGQGDAGAGRTMAVAFVGLAIVSLLTSITSQLMLIRLAQQAVFQLRLTLSRQILASDLAHLEKLGAPRLLATLTDDVQAVSDAVRFVPFLCIDIATVVGCLTYITWLSWQVFFLVAGLMVVATGSCQWLLDRGRQLLSLAREEQDQLFKHFRAATEGAKELKLNYWRRQAFLQEDLHPTAASFRRWMVRGLTLFAITSSWGKLIFFFAVGFVLFALPQFITINPQTLSGYILAFTYLMLPMDRLVNQLPILSRAGVALDKVESLGLSLASSAETLSVPVAAQVNWKELQLRRVTHTYGSDRDDTSFVLGPIDLTFHPGELVFIVGGNGSGKSTLAKLLVGLYKPETGDISLDGCSITAEKQEWYRQYFSVIFADFYLFDRLLGIEAPNLDTQARRYLQQLQLEHKVRIEQGQFSTTALSQGQRKRLALLTTYLDDRPIQVFDEWAADQDPVFKELFYTQFLPELRDRGKTIVVISHDDHYFHVADRLIKLDYGQVEYDKRLK